MARGFLSGAIWGTVLAVGALGALSVIDTNRTNRLIDGLDSMSNDPAAEGEAETAETPAAEPDVVAEAPATEATPEEPVAEPATQPEPVAASEPEPAPEPATPAPAPEAMATETTEVAVDPGTTSDPARRPAGETAVTAGTDAPGLDAPEAGADALPSEDAVTPSPTPETMTTAASEVTVDPDAMSDAGQRPSEEVEVTAGTDAPSLDTPAAGTDALPNEVETAPVPTPETGDVVAALTTPDAPDASNAQAPADSASVPNPPAAAPALEVPEGEVGLTVSTEPAQPPAPSVPEVDTALEPEADTKEPAPEANAADGDTATAAPERPKVRKLVPDTPDSPDATDGTEETAALARPAIGRPATSLVDRNSNGTSRLPSISSSVVPEDNSAADAPSEDTRPPLQRFAADYDVADPDLPRMAIVLIDDGTGPLGPDTLDNFPFPVTFALEPGQSGAAERMSAYRALGYEVAALANLPQGAQPTDVEQVLAGAVSAIPEAVALVEAPGGALQSERSNTEQASSFAADSGHGLVFLPNGLNTAEAIARRESVPAISVLRDFDGEGQDARTKRRFLDGAAFRARQDGDVVMLGRLTADTVSALLLWSLQDRASSVSMVPVSAILSDVGE